jgi:hypothetical protein
MASVRLLAKGHAMKSSITIVVFLLSLSVWNFESLSQQTAKDLTSQFEKGDISPIQDKRRGVCRR